MAFGQIIKLGSAALATSAVAGTLSLGVAGEASAAARAHMTAAQRADRTAIAYVRARHRGSCRARVLHTEPDVERGVRVFDVRTVAPNGTVYVVHVKRSNDHVLWANRAENQAGGCGFRPGGRGDS